MDKISLSEIGENRIGNVSKRSKCDVDAYAAGERSSKRVAFQLDTAAGVLFSAGCDLAGVSDAGQSFPSFFGLDDTEYGTSELESIAGRRVDDVSGTTVHEGAGMALPCSSGTTVQHGLCTGRSNYYPSDSATTLLKECFADNPPVQLDPHQQLTGMSSNRMVQITRAIGLEVLLATFGMLEDVLLKTGAKTGRNVGAKRRGQPPSFSRAGSTVIESVASQSFFSSSTITESFGSDPFASDVLQQPCSSRQADAALGFSETQVTDINDSNILKTLGKIRCDARKSGNL